MRQGCVELPAANKVASGDQAMRSTPDGGLEQATAPLCAFTPSLWALVTVGKTMKDPFGGANGSPKAAKQVPLHAVHLASTAPPSEAHEMARELFPDELAVRAQDVHVAQRRAGRQQPAIGCPAQRRGTKGLALQRPDPQPAGLVAPER